MSHLQGTAGKSYRGLYTLLSNAVYSYFGNCLEKVHVKVFKFVCQSNVITTLDIVKILSISWHALHRQRKTC